MGVSKKRKKKGKPVQRGEDRMSSLTLQDLINVVAYQEAHPGEAGKITAVIADDAVIHMPDEVPLTIGEGEDKRQIGTVSPIPGDDGQHVNINITDPDILKMGEGPVGSLSIDEKEQN